jgi:hypothetical protein
MKKLSIITLLLTCFFGYSQKLPTVVPASPEASALSKHINVPVSYYTGMPSINIPVYTINQKGISIPISLNYHARGVQLSEIASRTGQGWSLQYGGSVSRQIRGKADESPRNGYLKNKNDFLNYSSVKQSRDTVNSKEQSSLGYDFYPDQFSFSAGGYSGKFILSYIDGQPIIQSFGDLKISYTTGVFHTGLNGINSFTITDPTGTKYYFGISKDTLRTARDYQDSSGLSVLSLGSIVPDSQTFSSDIAPSSWKLMDVETPQGGLVSYYYTNTDLSVYYRKSSDEHETSGGGVNSVGNMSDITKIFTKVSRVKNYEKQLKKIVFNQGRDSILFIEAQNERQDYNGKALERISVYSKENLIKSQKLSYQYTHSTDSSNMLSYFTQLSGFDKYFYRMFLSSVQEEKNGQSLPPYVLTYNNSEPLPSMFSSKQDYWGYYNGANNNGPFTRMFNYGSYTPNRRVDTAKSEIGILKEIKYPTGGKTKLTYEHNRGSLPSGFSNLKIPSVNPIVNNGVDIILTKSNFLYVNGSYQPVQIQIPPSTHVNYLFDCVGFSEHVDDPIPDCSFQFTLKNSPVIINQNNTFYTNATTTETINIGVSTISGNEDTNNDFYIKISYAIPDDQTNLYGPGKRIKRIEQIDEKGVSSIKEYEYLVGGTTPSGAIIGLPAYLSGKEFINGFTIYSNYNDATSAYSSFQPNSIGYSSVIEYLGTKQNNIGKIEYIYTNLSDSGGDYYEFPYHPPTDNEWLRGKNIKTKYYKRSENASYFLEKEIYNKYLHSNAEFAADFVFPGLVDPTFPFTPEGSNHNYSANIALDTINSRTLIKLPMFMRKKMPYNETYPFVPGYRIYHLTGGTLNLLRTTEKNYNDSGFLETVTNYSYDYANHYQLAGSEFTNSKGELYKTNNNYSILSSPFRVLPTRTKSYKGNVKLSEQNTIYNINYLPNKIQTSKGTNALEDRIIFHSYDDKGNPTEVSKKDGTHVVYIWGYNQTQPIAKIENATYAEVEIAIASISNTDFNTLLKIQNVSNIDNDRTLGELGNEGNLRKSLRLLRETSGLSKSLITTYTYDPLIGVTSITDLRGKTIYYLYDSFNRLQYVKDNEGNILSENQYNYKN